MVERDETSQGAKWDRLWLAAVYVGLVVSTAVAVTRPDEAAADRPLLLGLSGLVAAWHWWMVTAHPQWLLRRAGLMALYFAVLLGLTGVLLARDPAYGVLLICCFPAAFVTLPGRLAYLGAVATGVLMLDVVALVEEWPASAALLIWPLWGIVLACVVGAALRAVESEAARRRNAYEELYAAHARLAELAEHNADLQDRLLGRARESGVLAERARMARELHDTLAQGLAGIVAQLEAADGYLERHHRAVRHTDTARDTARETLAEARRSVQALRPGPLDSGTLPAAVAAVSERWSAVHEIPVAVIVTGDQVRLSPEAEEALLRAVQEALANVARHAKAGHVGVTLTFMDDIVVLDVRDDGTGFDPGAGSGTAADGSGFGLTAMRHRIARFAGTVEVESAPGQGTAISVVVPAARIEAGGVR